MKADILIKDVNDSSTIVTIYYTKFGFDAWKSYSKPFGPSNFGDCTRFGILSIHLTDGENILNLDLGMGLLPELTIEAGRTGKGWVKSNGFLKSGKITWQVWNTRRTGDFGDKWMRESD